MLLLKLILERHARAIELSERLHCIRMARAAASQHEAKYVLEGRRRLKDLAAGRAFGLVEGLRVESSQSGAVDVTRVDSAQEPQHE